MSHQLRTVERIAEHRRVLVALDISDIAINDPDRRKGMGYLQRGTISGLMMITALAVTPEGEPLGVLAQRTWVREHDELGLKASRKKRPIEQKQSQRWRDISSEALALLEVLHGVEVILVADREADFYEFFADLRQARRHVLVRAKNDRRIVGEVPLLRQAIEQSEVAGRLSVEVGRSRERDPRHAELSVRFCQVTIPRPQPSGRAARSKSSAVPSSVDVSLVLVREEAPPDGEKPIEWLLLTTEQVTSHEQALRCARDYSRRWLIERFHYTLKSGLGVEKLQLQSRERLENAIALMGVCAWRLMHLLYRSRLDADADAATEFSNDEIRVLTAMATEQQPGREYGSNRKRAKPPITHLTLREAVRVIARMGGFMARTGDGEPGIKTLWKGLRKLDSMIEAIALIRQNPGLMGNG